MVKDRKSPQLVGVATYISFILIGLIPMLIYVVDYLNPIDKNLFMLASVLTGAGFVFIGWLKTYVTQTTIWKGILETLLLGAIASSVAYYVGNLLEHLLTK
jgi:VIT1/CCC1 family predicted Fe2+/Mn2+ transporter